MSDTFDLDGAIRRVKDFPKPGILFYDITSVLANPVAFNYCLQKMDELYRPSDFDCVAAIESRGFVFAAPFAAKHGLPLVLIRKKGKLPGKTISRSYALEYGSAEIEIHSQDIPQGARVLVVDDLIATGGTLSASVDLIDASGGRATAIFGVIGLPFLKYREALPDIPITTLVDYESENV